MGLVYFLKRLSKKTNSLLNILEKYIRKLIRREVNLKATRLWKCQNISLWVKVEVVMLDILINLQNLMQFLRKPLSMDSKDVLYHLLNVYQKTTKLLAHIHHFQICDDVIIKIKQRYEGCNLVREHGTSIHICGYTYLGITSTIILPDLFSGKYVFCIISRMR